MKKNLLIMASVLAMSAIAWGDVFSAGDGRNGGYPSQPSDAQLTQEVQLLNWRTDQMEAQTLDLEGGPAGALMPSGGS